MAWWHCAATRVTESRNGGKQEGVFPARHHTPRATYLRQQLGRRLRQGALGKPRPRWPRSRWMARFPQYRSTTMMMVMVRSMPATIKGQVLPPPAS